MKIVEPKNYVPDASIYPGKSLAEILESRGISQIDLARRANRPEQAINEIIKGKKEITADTALALEKILGIGASFWLQLEKNYRESLARVKEATDLEKQIPFLGPYPYVEMIKRNWVKDTRNKKERVAELLRWLGITNLENAGLAYQLAFRKSVSSSISKEKLIVWLRYGELEFQKFNFSRDFNTNSCDELMPRVRNLIIENVEKWRDELPRLCASYGIAVVYTQEFKSFPVYGVIRWLNRHPLIQVTLRYKNEDNFWFSIFHELGHAYRHDKQSIFDFMGEHRDSEIAEKEDEADVFACDNLIPHGKYKRFLEESRHLFTSESISSFAREIKVTPGIVVGRLQHDEYLGRAELNWLKQKLAWKH